MSEIRGGPGDTNRANVEASGALDVQEVSGQSLNVAVGLADSIAPAPGNAIAPGAGTVLCATGPVTAGTYEVEVTTIAQQGNSVSADNLYLAVAGSVFCRLCTLNGIPITKHVRATSNGGQFTVAVQAAELAGIALTADLSVRRIA